MSPQSKQQRVVLGGSVFLGDLAPASKNGLLRLESGGSLQKGKNLKLENENLTT